MVHRHPIRGAISGLLAGLGVAVLALIYGLVRIEGPWLIAAIVLVFTVLGAAFALAWPAHGRTAPD